jgi:tetratricopeptide (TPR) repeat protein
VVSTTPLRGRGACSCSREPGIGKSRLAEELASRARARGAQVLIGRCWEAGGAPAYWPWVQSLRTYARDTDAGTLRAQLGSGAAELAQLLPELRERFTDVPEPPTLESESARFRLFEAASSFLTSAAQARPLVLVFDDLHAADEPSLLLLQFLARQLGESRLLVIGAYRDVDPSLSDPLATALTELAREPVTKSLALTGLGDRDVAHFIELTTGEAPNDELVAAIQEETEGNPLFVGEIVRLLATEGNLENTAARSRLTIPQSVRDVIARRLRHLSGECNRVLVLACVLGREFSLAALARLGGVSENELLDTLDEAMIAGVVSDLPGAPGRLRFAHVLIRDTLYEELTAARRVRLHRLTVEALEDLYGDEPGSHLAELVQQSVAGNDFERGLRYTRRAGDRALGLLAYEEAARLYELALEALALSDPDDEATRCELLLSLGEGHARAGNMTAAKRTFLDAADIARRLGRSANLAHAAAGYGGRLAWPRAGEDDRLVPLLEEGLAALDDENVELRARLLGRLAGALRDEHSRDRRDRLSRESVELARRSGNATALAYALDGRAAAIFGPDTVAECLALGDELCEVAAWSGDREQAVAGHWLRILAQVIVGDVREAEVDLAAAARTADELRQPGQLWLVGATRAILALAAGRLDEAEELIPKALAFGQGATRDAAAAYLFQRYTLNCFRSRPKELEATIRASVDEYPTRPVFRCLLARLHGQLGRGPQAKRALAELAVDDFSALPFDQEWLYGMSLLAETCSFLSDPALAAVLHRLLRPYAALNTLDPPDGIRGSVSRYLGILATTMERWSDAERHFEDALAMNDRMGARPWLAYTQDDYARMLSARDLPGDRDRAHELLRTARITYRALGMDTDGSNVEIVNHNRA